MRRLLDWDVDGIITDYPDRLREVMARARHAAAGRCHEIAIVAMGGRAAKVMQLVRLGHAQCVGVDHRPQRGAPRVAGARRARAATAGVLPGLARMFLAHPAGLCRTRAQGTVVEIAKKRR